MTPLESARAQIVADLEARQGPWRRRSPALRAARLLLPTTVVVGGLMLLAPAHEPKATVVLAVAAAMLGLLGVSLAPERPSIAERVSQLATALAVLAIADELTCTGDVWALTPLCASVTTFFAVVMAATTTAVLWSSGTPLRLWHRLGLATTTTLGACAAIWHSCPGNTATHVWLAHGVAPLAVVALITFGVGRLLRRRGDVLSIGP